jgi:RNA polymerase sigma-70 factor, ECF subfamily
MDPQEFKRRIRLGETEKRKAISDLYREEYQFLHNWARRILFGRSSGRRPLDPEDIIQDVFISLFDTCEQFEGTASLRTYLSKAILRRVLDNAKSGPVTIELISSEVDGDDPLQNIKSNSNPEASVAAIRCMQKVLPALEETHDAQTLLTYELIIIEGRTYSELSKILDVPEGTLRQRVSAAMKTLHSLIQKLCGGID